MADKIIGIYCIKNKVNGKSYIGQTRDFISRVRSHKSDIKNKRCSNSYLLSSFEKYGYENFDFLMIEKCKIEELDEKEIYYINFYKTTNRNYGYNMELGGNKPPSWLGKKHSDETKEKISKSSKGNKHWLGKKHTSETKKKQSNAHKGIVFSKEHRKKLSISNRGRQGFFKGKHLSSETKEKIRLSHKGKRLSEEHKSRISEGGKGRKVSRQTSDKRVMTRRKITKGTSAYFGVSFKKRNSVWVVQTQINKKKIWIGECKIEIEAARMYDAYIIKNNLISTHPLNFREGV